MIQFLMVLDEWQEARRKLDQWSKTTPLGAGHIHAQVLTSRMNAESEARSKLFDAWNEAIDDAVQRVIAKATDTKVYVVSVDHAPAHRGVGTFGSQMLACGVYPSLGEGQAACEALAERLDIPNKKPVKWERSLDRTALHTRTPIVMSIEPHKIGAPLT